MFYGGATKFVATRRADLDAAVKRIKADAAEAETMACSSSAGGPRLANV